MGVGPASVMVGNLVAGKRIAQAAGRDLGVIEDQDLVRKVSSSTEAGTHLCFFEVDSSGGHVTCSLLQETQSTDQYWVTFL